MPDVIIDTVNWVGGRDGHARLIDQTRLPLEDCTLDITTVEQMVDAIRRLAVRGAPAIGVAAAYGVLVGLVSYDDDAPDAVLEETRRVAKVLAAARPTAQNLFWVLDRMVARAERDHSAGADIVDGLFDEASNLREETISECRRMGEFGAKLIADGARVLTHCNAGALATVGSGTALAPIYAASQLGRKVHVYADETRPLLQGARLTAWELSRAGVEVTVLTDNASGSLMNAGGVDAVFVGSDRIARNGDVCNKIGTYTVAVLAHRHGIPFYVVAPLSTFDPSLDHGGQIPIEQRSADEVTEGFGPRTAPDGVSAYNPAFDVTPADLVTAIITEVGVIEAPTTAKVEEALRAGNRLPTPS